MTEREFGFALELAARRMDAASGLLKSAAPGDHAAVLGASGQADMERVRRERAAAEASRKKAIADRQARNRAAYDARNPGWRDKAKANPRMARETGVRRAPASRPVVSSPASAAHAPAANAVAKRPVQPAEAPGWTYGTNEIGDRIAVRDPRTIRYGVRQYGSMDYFDERLEHYRKMKAEQEAARQKAIAEQEAAKKKQQGFNPGNVPAGGGVPPPSRRSNNILDRVEAIKAERQRQAAEAYGAAPAKGVINDQRPIPHGGSPFETAPAAQPTGAPGDAARARRARAYAPTAQMAAMASEFDSLPQARQLELMQNAGVGMRDWMRASGRRRDDYIMRAAEAHRKAIADMKARQQARIDAWRNAPGFRNGIKTIDAINRDNGRV